MVASEIHYPSTITEVLELQRRHPSTLLFAGGTEILRDRGGRFVDLPPILALLEGIAELKTVNRSERFVDIGAGLTLAEALELRPGTLPKPLVSALEGIATPSVRNLATLGGNIATKKHFMDSWGVLACLEALVELRDGAGPRWVNVNRLVDSDARPSFPAGALLSRVRLPIENWSWWVVRKIGSRSWPTEDSAVFTLLARVEKGLVTAFRLSYAGQNALRFPVLESRLVGTRLPLAAKEKAELCRDYKEAALEIAPAMAPRFSLLVEMAFEHFSR